ncbi:hypothetical protein [Nitratidesulfovibrio termitidis]|uniref:hypothetical protein n=1 Tax=Nitratidesulfovibrio termitidis TaxID=42252 RepID=UPI0012EB40A0|nr:hypothetical protein [Nitratidesulfovibrio termitidis]
MEQDRLGFQRLRCFRTGKRLKYAFAACGSDLQYMLDAQRSGRINTWDIQICYAQFKQHAVTVYPVRSYTANIGLDGSGTHFKENGSRFISALGDGHEARRFPEHIFFDDRILVAFRKVYAMPGLATRIVNKVWRIFFGRNLIVR